MALPPGTIPIGGPIVPTAAARPAPTQALFDAGVVLPEDGRWYGVVETGDADEPYAWAAVSPPPGTTTRNRLIWDDDLQQWGASAPVSENRGYPYFVLTRDADTTQLEQALDWFVQNTGDAHFQGQAGRPFSVSGGTRNAAGIGEATGQNRITDVWLEGAAAPTWWAVANAINDRAEGYWITYRVLNQFVVDVKLALTDTPGVVAGDFADLASGVWHTPFQLPVFAGQKYGYVWTPDGLERTFRFLTTDEIEFDPRTSSARTPLEIGGVSGGYHGLGRSNTTLDSADYSGVTRLLDFRPTNTSVLWPQPHPVIERGVIRINGILHDVAREQLVGDRPDSPADRTIPGSPWGIINLGYSPAESPPNSVALVP